MVLSVLDSYRDNIKAGTLRPDPAQDRVAAALDRLARSLAGYRPAPLRRGLGRLSECLATTRQTPRGLYIHGVVGCGKTMLMDLFFKVAPVTPRRRIHFHGFMQEVHDKIHHRRQTGRQDHDDMIADIAADITAQATLLCFDEFHLGDIADAMILGRLFQALFDYGLVMVATSNVAPGHLYENGHNRDLVLPFIALMQAKLQVIALDGEKDYRTAHGDTMPIYLTPDDAGALKRMESLWHRLSGGARGSRRTLTVKGRPLYVPRATDGLAWFSFAQLCRTRLGPADFLALARAFHTIFVTGIPKIGPHARDEARRFILFIDTLYDNNTRLVACAEAEPRELHACGDEALWFRRAASRLVEMQSRQYWTRSQKL
ncbi:MAG: cell division protein ZapE [Hyphomicrobiales bacterium]